MFSKSSWLRPVSFGKARISQRSLAGLPAQAFRRLLRIETFEARLLLAADMGVERLLKDYPLQPADQSHADHAEVGNGVFIPPATSLINYGGYLTEPTDGTARQIAERYLLQNADSLGLSESDLRDLVVTDLYSSSHNQLTHVYMQQRHNGLPIANAHININIDSVGRVLNVGSSFIAGLESEASAVSDVLADSRFTSLTAVPQIESAEALVELAEHFGWELAGTPQVVSQELEPANRGRYRVLTASGISLEDIPAELQYVPQQAGGVELAWRFNVQTTDSLHWYDVNVSAIDGEVLFANDWVNAANYNVYALPKENPNDGPRTIESDPLNSLASPFGWHDTNAAAGAEFTVTRGNNVWAYADRNGDDVADTGSSPDGTAALVFNSPIDLTQQPINYQAASVTNLFYWSNVLHDIYYKYGFTEAAGNFQENNYGKGGVGGDSLRAEAQDSADGGPGGPQRNNARFATPPDGLVPRMEMFLYNQSTPERDSSLDNGIVIHEYTHGLSNRLTGGPLNAGALSTLQSAGMGEGWSDWFSLMLTQVATDTANMPRPVGTYAEGQLPTGAGTRSRPYSYNMAVNNLTFGAIVGQLGIHFIGEVWSSVLWDLNWALISGNSLDPALPAAGRGFNSDFLNGNGGNNLAMQLVIDAMKLQRVTPTFLEARDAILAADVALTGGANQLTIWTVFARRGMGFSADDGGTSNTSDVIEAFDLPATPDGKVRFDQIQVAEGSLLSITLRDSDLTSGNQVVQVMSSSGDVESVTLAPLGILGVFRGTLDTGAGIAAVDNVLQVNSGDTLTVSYVDLNNGTGGTNLTKTGTANITTRMAKPLIPQVPQGVFLSTSDNTALLRSASDIEPFTFFAEAGEKIGVTARPIGNAQLNLRIVGLSPVYQAATSGALVNIPLTQIPATGLYKVWVGTSAAASAEVTVSRNAVSEKSLGDSADGRELNINSSLIQLGTGRRYAASAQSVPVGPGIINGSFETGDFTGWDIRAAGNVLAPWTVSRSGAGSGYGMIPTQPQQGSFVAWNGFEGAGPLSFTMTQNVMLPPVPVTLTWKHRLQWNFDFVPGIATEGRTFDVQIRNPENGNILGTVFSFDTRPEYITPAGDTGWQTRTADLSNYAGQFVQLAFIEYVPQQITGPGQFEIDDISLIGMPASAPDGDEFLVNLRAGQNVDVILASERGNFSTATLQLLGVDGSTLLATGTQSPIAAAGPVRNYALGISGFTIPADGAYTLRVASSVRGDYRLVVTEGLAFDTEANDSPQPSLLRSLDARVGAIGHVDGVSQYVVNEVPFEYEDLSVDSLYVFLAEDQVSNARPIGFGFSFYGQTYNNLYISSNGFLSFLNNQGDGCCLGQTMPNTALPNAIIAGWWRDLNAANAALNQFIRHKTVGPVGNREFHLEYKDVPHFSDSALLVSLQIKLFEANGDIEVHYRKAPGDEREHSAGIENQTGTNGVLYYRGMNSLPENLALRYSRASSVDHYSLTLAAGQEVTLQTRTPFDATGHPVPNSLNPELRVIHPDGSTLVGSDLNSLDGKNARLTITAPVAGVYTVELRATSGAGDYVLEKYEPPRVKTIQFGDGTQQRSRVNRLVVEFNQVVDLQSGAFELNQRLPGGGLGSAIGLATPQIDNSSGRSIVTLAFSGAEIVGGSLPDGNFILRLLSDRIRVAGRGLDGDNNGAAGGDFVRGTLETDNFFRYFGDLDGNRNVGLIEFGTGRLAVATIPGDSSYDDRFDYDGALGIGLVDFGQLRIRFGTSLSFN